MNRSDVREEIEKTRDILMSKEARFTLPEWSRIQIAVQELRSFAESVLSERPMMSENDIEILLVNFFAGKTKNLKWIVDASSINDLAHSLWQAGQKGGGK